MVRYSCRLSILRVFEDFVQFQHQIFGLPRSAFQHSPHFNAARSGSRVARKSRSLRVRRRIFGLQVRDKLWTRGNTSCIIIHYRTAISISFYSNVLQMSSHTVGLGAAERIIRRSGIKNKTIADSSSGGRRWGKQNATARRFHAAEPPQAACVWQKRTCQVFPCDSLSASYREHGVT